MIFSKHIIQKNMVNNKIAVVVPIYNVELWLEQCLDSIVKQTEPFDEVILVNDGSTDRSIEICEHYCEKYKQFKLYSQPNKGLGAARNVGIEQAISDYIMFLDSDDWLREDTVYVLKQHLEKDFCEVLYFDAAIIIETVENSTVNQNMRNIYDRSKAGLDNQKMTGWEYFERSYPRYYTPSACLALYKKKILDDEQLRFPEGVYFEDNLFSFIFCNIAKTTLHISQMLYQRRYRTGSIMTGRYSEKKFFDHIKCAEGMWEYIQDIDWKGKERKLLLQIVNDGFATIIDGYNICIKENIQINNKIQKRFLQSISHYIEILQLFKFASQMKDITNLVIAQRNLAFLIKENFRNDIEIAMMLDKVTSSLEKYYLTLFEGIQLEKSEKKIGIYGMGRHTEGLISIFEKLKEGINCDLVFIDSKIDKGEYRGRKIINYKEIDDCFDLIIVSSFVYEAEMVQNVKSIGKDIPIYRFYEHINTDIFSEYKSFLWCLERKNIKDVD